MSTTPSSPLHAPSSPSAGGRPRSLDDTKRREICALVAGGCGLREAARYVRCSVDTIRREARRNPEFQDQLSRSEMYAQLSPLRAMQHACATHWRAAAWFLERAFPDRFARRDPTAFGPQQARRLLNEVLDIIGSEIADPVQHERIEKRLRATFEYSLRMACDRRRSSRDLRRAIDFFEQKDRLNDPLAQFGFPTPNIESLFKPTPMPQPDRPSPQSPAPRPPESFDPFDTPITMSDLAAALRDMVNDTKSPSADHPAAPPPDPDAHHEYCGHGALPDCKIP
jgi:hypothetical protein